MTTVGYGDVVPTTLAGRVIGGLVMAIGIAFISFVTAGVTSALVQRAAEVAHEADLANQEQTKQRIVDELGKTNQMLTELATASGRDRLQARRLDLPSAAQRLIFRYSGGKKLRLLVELATKARRRFNAAGWKGERGA